MKRGISLEDRISLTTSDSFSESISKATSRKNSIILNMSVEDHDPNAFNQGNINKDEFIVMRSDETIGYTEEKEGEPNKFIVVAQMDDENDRQELNYENTEEFEKNDEDSID